MEVDLCFVMECTGFMSCHIEAAKDCIGKIADHMSKMAMRIRVGFCGYRDYCDGDNRLQIFDFTNSCTDFSNYISANVSASGGDSPKDVLGGLNAAVTQMTWRNTTRVLLHVGGHPPHGCRFTSGDDSYPDGDPNGLTAEGVLGNMTSKNIHYFFGRITDQTEKMISEFRKIIGEFDVFNLETGGDQEELVKKFTDATCSSNIGTSISLIE